MAVTAHLRQNPGRGQLWLSREGWGPASPVGCKAGPGVLSRHGPPTSRARFLRWAAGGSLPRLSAVRLPGPRPDSAPGDRRASAWHQACAAGFERSPGGLSEQYCEGPGLGINSPPTTSRLPPSWPRPRNWNLGPGAPNPPAPWFADPRPSPHTHPQGALGSGCCPGALLQHDGVAGGGASHDLPPSIQRYLEVSAEITWCRNLSTEACMAGPKSPG